MTLLLRWCVIAFATKTKFYYYYVNKEKKVQVSIFEPQLNTGPGTSSPNLKKYIATAEAFPLSQYRV
jgi:hypothetical protein